MKPKALLFPLGLILASSATAGTFIWTGATSSVWTDSSNWDTVTSPTISPDTFPNYGSTYTSDALTIRNNGDLINNPAGVTAGAAAVFDPGAGVTTLFDLSSTRGLVIGIGAGPNPSAEPPYPGAKGRGDLTISSGTLKINRSTNSGSEPYMANRADATLLINGGHLDLSGHVNNFRLIQEGFPGITSTLTLSSGAFSCRVFDLLFDTESTPSTVFGDGVINLDGGVFTVSRFIRAATADPGQTTSTLNLNGGTLRTFATIASPNIFLQPRPDTRVIVKAGGAIIDTNTFSNTISADLEHDSSLGNSSDGGLTKNNTGTLTLSGNNTYNGGTTLNAGFISISSDANLGAPTGGFTFGATTSLSISASITDSDRIVTLSPGVTGTIQLGGAVEYTNTGKFTGPGSLQFRKSGTGGRTATLASLDNDFTGSLTVDHQNTSGEVITVVLNSLADPVGAGNIIYPNFNNVFPNLTWGSEATTGLTIENRRIELAGTMGTGTLSINNQNATHPVIIKSDLLVSGAAGVRRLALQGVAGPVNEFAGDIADGTDSAVSIIKGNTAGVWTLSGNNSHTGGVTLNGTSVGSQLNINSPTALGTGSFVINNGNNGKIDNTSGAALTLTTNNSQNWNNDFSFLGTDDLNLGTGPVNLGGTRSVTVLTGGTLTVGGSIGAGTATPGLMKNGNGTLILTGNSTYQGATTVNFGRLIVNSPGSLHPDSAVTITNFGILGGNGTINGSVAVSGSNAKIAPGAAAGTLSIGGNLDLATLAGNSGARLVYELGADTASSDRITVGGTLSIGAGAFGFNDFEFTNLGSLQAGTYTLITSAGITAGDTLDAANLSGNIGSFSGTLAISGNDIVLTVSAGAGGFSAWQTANSTAGGLGADHDNDGVSNGIEFFLFGPVNTTGFTGLPGITPAGNSFSITWNKDDAYDGEYGTDYVIQTSESLAGNSWMDEPSPGSVTITGDEVKYTFPSGTRKFARLKVTGP